MQQIYMSHLKVKKLKTLYFIKQYVISAYGEEEVERHAFFSLGLDSHPGYFISMK